MSEEDVGVMLPQVHRLAFLTRLTKQTLPGDLSVPPEPSTARHWDIRLPSLCGRENKLSVSSQTSHGPLRPPAAYDPLAQLSARSAGGRLQHFNLLQLESVARVNHFAFLLLQLEASRNLPFARYRMCLYFEVLRSSELYLRPENLILFNPCNYLQVSTPRTDSVFRHRSSQCSAHCLIHLTENTPTRTVWGELKTTGDLLRKLLKTIKHYGFFFLELHQGEFRWGSGNGSTPEGGGHGTGFPGQCAQP
ncbi:uncharacterized protein LOC121109594 [Gallus gallus]|uniref:uncharacterized protein LOC121109594 n=1 Tax=Gallus gallus TaxID=9031 RepID=UPI001AE4A16E|nr:uncharacterized protein LOC121109594 [Gallus gallus]